MMSLTAILGLAAGTVTVGSFIPQVLRVWRTRRTGDLSMGTFALLAVGTALWLGYGLITRDWPVVLTNFSVMVLAASVVVAKLRFG